LRNELAQRRGCNFEVLYLLSRQMILSATFLIDQIRSSLGKLEREVYG